MPTWSDFEAAAPDLALEVRARLDAHTHKTLATLRRDGAPRISGTEIKILAGELWLGSMWGARKARDLRRDPRYALHSGSDDPPGWVGDAKLAGRAEEVTDPARIAAVYGGRDLAEPFHVFRLDVREASVVRLAPSGKAIVLEWWTPEGGLRTLERG